MPDIVTGKIFTDGEKGITATKMNQIQSLAVIQPDFVGTKPAASSIAATDQLLILQTSNVYARAPFSTVSSSVAGQIPVADATQNGMLRQVSGLTTDVVDGTNHCVNAAAMPGITQMRLRSFNALGNSNFECDQRNVGTALTNPANGVFVQDRWSIFKSASLTGTVNFALQSVPSAPITVPGTNFAITRSYQRYTVGTAQATLAAGDFYGVSQAVEGSNWRELSLDVHSFQILVRSSIAGTFTLRLRDATTTRSLVILCTISSANTWTLVTLPNLPVWAGTYSALPGQIAYYLDLFFACGSTYLAAASAAWQNGDVRGISGMSNFLATSGATLDIAYIGHEPGSQCTTLQDKPFVLNYDECLRYYQKTYDYATALGNTAQIGQVIEIQPGAGTSILGYWLYKKTMAKTPTLTCYSSATGAINAVRDLTANTDRAVTAGGPSTTSLNYIAVSTAIATGARIDFHYVVDTGW